jgi:hypothetical protein
VLHNITLFHNLFGTPPRYLDPSDIHTAIIIVGGIGCTPMMSILTHVDSQVLAVVLGYWAGFRKLKFFGVRKCPLFLIYLPTPLKACQQFVRIEWNSCLARTPKAEVKTAETEMQPAKPFAAPKLDIISGRMDVAKTIKTASETANRQKVSVFMWPPSHGARGGCNFNEFFVELTY